MLLNKLALGTAQFGSNYGVANFIGKIDISEQKLIIDHARKVGVDTIDTAINYGTSENNLGTFDIKDFKLVTKIPSIPKNCENIENWLFDQFNKSLNRLNLESIYALLLHDSKDIIRHQDKVLKFFENLKKHKKIKKFGVSIYCPKELEEIFKITNLEIIQTPLSIIDNSIITSGWLDKLKKMNVEVHARSIFLQGLLLLEKKNMPKKFLKWDNVWDNWFKFLNEHQNLDPIQICTNYVISNKKIDKVVIGIDNFNQFNQIINLVNLPLNCNFPNISSDDKKLIYPYNWKDL